MFSSNRPKFSFDLTINELSNIPQVNGSCFIQLSIRDGKNHKLSDKLTPHHHHHHNSNVSSKDSKSSTHMQPNDSTSTSLSLNLAKLKSGSNNGIGNNNNTSSSSNHISTTTSRKRIHNFKCTFNYNLTCNLKFPLKKNENLIGNKYLSLRVYYVTEKSTHRRKVSDNNQSKNNPTNGNEDSSKSSHDDNETVIDLGRVDVNLSEYLNFNEQITSKYLLKESKVNSILSLSISLSELPSNYDFHTQLQINDNQSHSTLSTAPTNSVSRGNTDSSLGKSSTSNLTNSDGNNGTHTSNSGFNVPQFERKNVFGGINNVFSDNHNNSSHSNLSSASEEDSSPPPSTSGISNTTATSSSSNSHAFLGKLKRNNSHSKKSHPSNNTSNSTTTSGKNDSLQQKSSVIMDPLINGLYSKILENTWDPELYHLLSYSPEKCINDIFDNPKNPLGYNPDLMPLKDGKSGSTTDENGDDDGDDEGFREINGLINEIKFRDDLKSWNIKV
ncbi:N-terminal C2 in EEIG1 and EHBP1 proteins-domain-containing protein [Scheffersomyces coipomensis]|uniref:N-terminal C2 in EEIG1 and EHBP1 proteins-domain-containing protein n=1 Tax=Scheffersomyces coipomensis TaxID=1788519 RepID=UPI00315C655E